MFRAVVVVCCLVLFGSPLSAQMSADAKELQRYTLTVPVMKQVVTATRQMLVGMKNDPRYQKAMTLEAEKTAIEKKEEPTDAELDRLEQIEEELDAIGTASNFLNDQSLDEMEAAARKEPIVLNALKSAGLSAREYAKFMAAFLQASMIAGFQQGGMLKEMPKEVNPANVAFLKEHQAEIQAFMKEMETLGRQ